MADMDSLNSCEYVYEQKSEGKVRMKRRLMAAFYFVFGIGLFVLCLSINPYLFAIGPLSVYILFLLTWRLVKYDCYWEFEHGKLTVGKVKVTKHGRHKTPKLDIIAKSALEVGYFEGASSLAGAEVIYDYSESQSSDKRVYLIYERDGKKRAIIIEATARLAGLLVSYCPEAKGIKGKQFHG